MTDATVLALYNPGNGTRFAFSSDSFIPNAAHNTATPNNTDAFAKYGMVCTQSDLHACQHNQQRKRRDLECQREGRGKLAEYKVQQSLRTNSIIRHPPPSAKGKCLVNCPKAAKPAADLCNVLQETKPMHRNDGIYHVSMRLFTTSAWDCLPCQHVGYIFTRDAYFTAPSLE